MKKSIQAWAIYDANIKGIDLRSFQKTRAKSIKDWERDTGDVWNEAYYDGFRCIKVKIEYEV